MGYLHINNLYKNQEILMFKECYALEKIHGTSTHITFSPVKQTQFFSGGVSHYDFVGLFDEGLLNKKFKELNIDTEVIIYGEGYGGKIQSMKNIYGNKLKFIAFSVKIGHSWLSVPKAEEFVKQFDIEFVDYEKISTDLKEIDRLRDKDSTQAIRNGMGLGKKREGIVLRSLIELKKNNGSRIIVKHKRDDFKETRTKREIKSPEKLKIWEGAKEIANEWVTIMRLNHVIDKIENPCIEKMRLIIYAMQEDVKREGSGEIIWGKEVAGAIGRRTAQLFKEHLKGNVDNK